MSPKEFRYMGTPYDDFCPKCKKSKRECTCARYVSPVNRKKDEEKGFLRPQRIVVEAIKVPDISKYQRGIRLKNSLSEQCEFNITTLPEAEAKRLQKGISDKRGPGMSGLR